jgi:ankyrin repeat protein
MSAIQSKSAPDVSQALAQGASPDATDGHSTALTLAASLGASDIVAALVRAGAHAGQADQDGSLPLNQAAYFGDAHMVEALIAGGANVNAADQQGSRSLDHAKTAEMARLLRAHGAHR